ncbi:uncharacterized protein LOC111398476 isoform X3 [Olea europaea var. sylvestris]|uniref:uncharacterized protein LOC111398476 isoform X3 n=1 Tax=Olea europaea var. sylvestris TaxID=158386 RepID=UPI000C1D4C6F|nr:uncharacterized protein LOC111398476 isoform X3 [Olea europaea var. sylvestris]
MVRRRFQRHPVVVAVVAEDGGDRRGLGCCFVQTGRTLFSWISVLMRTLADVSHNQNGLSASQIAFNAVNKLQTEDLPMRCMEREGSRDKNPNIIAGDFGLQMKLKSII